MKIALGSDHAGFDAKVAIKAFLEEKGYQLTDFGCHDKSSVDYPDFAKSVGEAVACGEFDRGILFCHTGIGMSIAANKVAGVRCALCADLLSTRLTRQHNDTNVLAIGAGMLGIPMIMEIVALWLETAFEGGRHQRRVEKMMKIEVH